MIGADEALTKMRGIVYAISHNRAPLLTLIDIVNELALDAIELLKEPDNEKRDLAKFIFLFQGCVRIKETNIGGRIIRRATITDSATFNFIAEEAEAMRVQL